MTAMTNHRRVQANRYLGDSLGTASPSTLLVMVYERLVLDLQRAETAQLTGDREAAHLALLHAQDIVHELQNSLDRQAWDGADGLSALYTWLLKQLIAANLSGDAGATATCRVEVVEPLAEAWRQAALENAGNVADPHGGVA